MPVSVDDAERAEQVVGAELGERTPRRIGGVAQELTGRRHGERVDRAGWDVGSLIGPVVPASICDETGDPVGGHRHAGRADALGMTSPDRMHGSTLRDRDGQEGDAVECQFADVDCERWVCAFEDRSSRLRCVQRAGADQCLGPSWAVAHADDDRPAVVVREACGGRGEIGQGVRDGASDCLEVETFGLHVRAGQAAVDGCQRVADVVSTCHGVSPMFCSTLAVKGSAKLPKYSARPEPCRGSEIPS